MVIIEVIYVRRSTVVGIVIMFCIVRRPMDGQVLMFYLV